MPTHPSGNRYECPQCRGVASTKADLGLMLGFRRRTALIRTAEHAGHVTYLECPFCSSPMSSLEVDIAAGKMELECCVQCESIWLDHGKLAHLSGVELAPLAAGSGLAELHEILAAQRPSKGSRMIELLRAVFRTG